MTRHWQRYAQVLDDLSSTQPTEWLEAEAKKKLVAKTPLGVPWLDANDLAPTVVFLASDEAGMITGAAYDVTGGDSANNAT